MTFNAQHRRALKILGVTAAADVALGVWFGIAAHVSVWEGIFYATGTAVTAGADITTPRGWQPHVVTFLMFITCVPLFTGSFSFITAGLTADHIRRASLPAAEHAEAAHKIAADLYEQHTGEEHPLAGDT